MTGHIPLLDGVRGVAVLLVMLHHQTILVPKNTFDLWFYQLAHVGWCGVDLFFVLSGFLITGILLDTRGSGSYFRSFYARRTLRIFPLYYAVVLLSLVVLPHLPSGIVPAEKLANFGRVDGDEVWYWTYLSNYAIAASGAFRHAILDISWSLAIEEQFYLVWPIVVLMAGPHRLLRICGLMIVGALALRSGLWLAGVAPLTTYVITPARLDGLAAGAAVACLARTSGLVRWRGWATGALSIAGAVLLLSILFNGALEWDSRWVQTVGFTCLTVLFSSTLLVALTGPEESRLSRLLGSRFLRFFGKYSYALYLFHLPLRAVIRDTFMPPERLFRIGGSAVPGQLLFYVLATALASSFAVASFYLYENHFLKLKRWFPAELALRRSVAP